MAHVSGPCRTLPGHTCYSPEGTFCDEHEGVVASKRVQGETDSFGAEYIDMCDECYAAFLNESKIECCGVCDWCKHESTQLAHRRDLDEGSCGPVYKVCPECIKKENKRAQEELEERSANYYSWRQ